jgi:hypothetical protein
MDEAAKTHFAFWRRWPKKNKQNRKDTFKLSAGRPLWAKKLRTL